MTLIVAILIGYVALDLILTGYVLIRSRKDPLFAHRLILNFINLVLGKDRPQPQPDEYYDDSEDFDDMEEIEYETH